MNSPEKSPSEEAGRSICITEHSPFKKSGKPPRPLPRNDNGAAAISSETVGRVNQICRQLESKPLADTSESRNGKFLPRPFTSNVSVNKISSKINIIPRSPESQRVVHDTSNNVTSEKYAKIRERNKVKADSDEEDNEKVDKGFPDHKRRQQIKTENEDSDEDGDTTEDEYMTASDISGYLIKSSPVHQNRRKLSSVSDLHSDELGSKSRKYSYHKNVNEKIRQESEGNAHTSQSKFECSDSSSAGAISKSEGNVISIKKRMADFNFDSRKELFNNSIDDKLNVPQITLGKYYADKYVPSDHVATIHDSTDANDVHSTSTDEHSESLKDGKRKSRDKNGKSSFRVWKQSAMDYLKSHTTNLHRNKTYHIDISPETPKKTKRFSLRKDHNTDSSTETFSVSDNQSQNEDNSPLNRCDKSPLEDYNGINCSHVYKCHNIKSSLNCEEKSQKWSRIRRAFSELYPYRCIEVRHIEDGISPEYVERKDSSTAMSPDFIERQFIDDRIGPDCFKNTTLADSLNLDIIPLRQSLRSQAASLVHQDNEQTNTTSLSSSNTDEPNNQTNNDPSVPHRIDFKKYLINPDRQIARRSSFTDVEDALKGEASNLTIPKKGRQCISLPRSQLQPKSLMESPISNINRLSCSSPSSSNDSVESSLTSSQEIYMTSSVTSDTSVSTSPSALRYRSSETLRRDSNTSNQTFETTKQERLCNGCNVDDSPKKNTFRETNIEVNETGDLSPSFSNNSIERKSQCTKAQDKGALVNGCNKDINMSKKYPISASSIAAAISNNKTNLTNPFPAVPTHHSKNSPNLTLTNPDKCFPQESHNPIERQQCSTENFNLYSANFLDKSSGSNTVSGYESELNININESPVNSPSRTRTENAVKVKPKPLARMSVEKTLKSSMNESLENSVKLAKPCVKHEIKNNLSDTSHDTNNLTSFSQLNKLYPKGKIEKCSGMDSGNAHKTSLSARLTEDKQYLTVSPNKSVVSDSPSSIPRRNIAESRSCWEITTKPLAEPVVCNKESLKQFPYPEAAPLKYTKMSASAPISPIAKPKRTNLKDDIKSPMNKPEVPSKPMYTVNTKGSRIPISKSTRSVTSTQRSNRLVMNRLTNPYDGLRLSSNPSLSNMKIELNQDSSVVNALEDNSFETLPALETIKNAEGTLPKKKRNNCNEYFESSDCERSPAIIAEEATIAELNRRMYLNNEETCSNWNSEQKGLEEIEAEEMHIQPQTSASLRRNNFIRSTSCEVQVGSPTRTTPTTNSIKMIDTQTKILHKRTKSDITKMPINSYNYQETNKNGQESATLTSEFKELQEGNEIYTTIKQDAAAQTSRYDIFDKTNDKPTQGTDENIQFRHDAAAQTCLETDLDEIFPDENVSGTLRLEFASNSSLASASIPMNSKPHIRMGGAALKVRPASEMIDIKQHKNYNTNYSCQNALEPSRSVDQIQQIVFMEEGHARLYDLKPASCQNVHILSPNNMSYVGSYGGTSLHELSFSSEQNSMKSANFDQYPSTFSRPELHKKLSSSLASGLNESFYGSGDSYIFQSNDSLKDATYSEFEPRRRRTASMSNIEYERRKDCRKNPKRSRFSAFFGKFQRKKKPSILANDVDLPTHFRVIGRILEMCLDGTRIIELTQPPHGLCGIYMTRIKHNLGHSIYVSRFSDGYPAKMFAGLLSIGDEILEINGISTGCMTVEDAHDMVASCDKLILRVLPNKNVYRKSLM